MFKDKMKFHASQHYFIAVKKASIKFLASTNLTDFYLQPQLTFQFCKYTSPTNTPRVFHVKTTWKQRFPRRFDVDYTWIVCRVEIIMLQERQNIMLQIFVLLQFSHATKKRVHTSMRFNTGISFIAFTQKQPLKQLILK